MIAIGLDRADRAILIVATLAALAIGVVSAAISPLIPLGATVAVLVWALICWRPIAGVGLFVGVVATLPFGVIPVPLAGAQLTFVDALLLAMYVSVLARVIGGSLALRVDTPALALVAFVLVAIAAFIASAGSGLLTPEMLRRTGKLLASLLFFLVARSVLSTEERLARLARWLMFAGAIQGGIAAGLMALSPITQLNLLSRLQVIGYPTSDILRYVPGPNDTYTTQLRAIGTSVDPNVLGGTLMLALVTMIVQWASPRPVLPRSIIVLLALPTAAGVLLSLSRASWIGLAAGLVLIGVTTYRRILGLGAVVVVGVLASPIGQSLFARFTSGFSTADPATAFRVGEYANAISLLARYPLLGIGFGASPDIDVTAGVSSVYLLVGEQTGLLGLACYLLALLSTWFIGLHGLRRVAAPRLQGIRAGFLGALSGALVAGLLDHYFANQAFPHAVALFWLYAAALVAAARLCDGLTCPRPRPDPG